MPKTTDSINRDLYNFLKTKNFEPKPLGKNDIAPEDAKVFEFHFHSNNEDYGSMHIAIDNLNNIILFYNKSAISKVTNAFTKFIKELRRWGRPSGLALQLDDQDDLGDYMKKREYNERKINEGYYGTRQTSYSDKTPDVVKLIIKHSKSLDESDQRYRYIEKIFVENSQGERFLLPTRKPSVGHVFARHIAEGGTPYDERGKHIAQLSEDISTLGAFLRATKNKQFNESVQRAISESTEHYIKLKETMKKLRSARGFRQYFESWKPSLMETDDITALETAFKSTYLDPRIESALPVLSRYKINISEMQEVNEFENWANNIIDEELNPTLPGQVDELLDLVGPESEPLPLGPDASNAIRQLEDLIEDDLLYSRLRKAAQVDANNDARPIIVGWMSEKKHDEYEEILDKLDSEDLMKTPSQSTPASQQKMQQQTPPAPEKQQPVAEDDLTQILKLSGHKK